MDIEQTIGNELTFKGKQNGDANGNVEVSIGDAVTMQGWESKSLGRIDQYELVRELGGGGFGSVYLARDTVGGIEVAVKGLPPFVKINKEELENIQSNFALVSRLHHPNIAAALVLHPAKTVSYDDREAAEKLRVFEGDTLMVMQYAPGVTLSQWCKQFPDKKVPCELAIEVVRQIASALDYAHERKIVHRDIKPSNVMIETDAGGVVARLLDFGLAAEIRSSMGRVSREIRDTSGTRPFMAPEQWSGEKQGAWTDQYALAVLFNELVTGEVPFASVFECGDPTVMKMVITKDPFTASSELPRSFRRALNKALEKDPARRFARCVDFVEALGGNNGLWSSVARSRGVVVLGSVFFSIVVLGCVAVVWYQKSQAKRIALQQKQEEFLRIKEEQAEKARAKAEAAEREREKLEKEQQRQIAEEQKRLKEWEAKIQKDREAFEAAKRTEAAAEIARQQSRVENPNGESEKLKAEQAKRQREMAELEMLIRVKCDIANEYMGQMSSYRDDKEGFVSHLAVVDAKHAEIQKLQSPQTIEEAKKALSAVSEASDAIAVELAWLKSNKVSRDRARTVEREIVDEIDPKIKSFRVEKVAVATYTEGQRLRKSGIAMLQKADFTDACKTLVAAKTKLSDAVEEAKAWHIMTTLEAAREYKKAEVWEKSLDSAKKVLSWDSENKEAIALKAESESHLVPSLRIVTKIDGVEVAGVDFVYGDKHLKSPAIIKKFDGGTLAPISIDYERVGKRYRGSVAGMSVDWVGVRSAVVDLEEFVDTQAKTEVEFGDNEVGQSSPAQGTQSSQSRTPRVEHFGFFSQTSNKTPSEDKDSEEGFDQTGDGFGQTEKKEEGFFSSLWRGISEPPKPGCKWRRSSGRMCGAPTVGESEYCGLHKCKFCNEPYLKNGRCEEHQHYR